MTYVYFIQASDSWVKIGIAKDVQRRLTALQSANATDLRCRAILPGGTSLERALHEHFGENRLRGEWFAPHDDLIEFIDNTFSTIIDHLETNGRPQLAGILCRMGHIPDFGIREVEMATKDLPTVILQAEGYEAA